MNSIKPIETSYAGCRFRSRLEARWAVFFDHLGIRWEYEPQGYLISGRPYLPDFLLTLPGDAQYFAEVKPGNADGHEGEHVDFCRGLASAVGQPVLLLNGLPSLRMWSLFPPDAPSGNLMAAFFKDYGDLLTTADDYWFRSIEVNLATGALEFTHNERDAAKSFGRGLLEAITAARSARFEHGQHG